MSEKSISDSKENFEIRDKNMPISETIERTVLSQYNFNYNVSENDDFDVSSQLVIDETYTSSQPEQSQKSENIIFPEQDMSVYDCSQPEIDTNTITCPNRVIFSSEVMDFVNSQNSCDNDDDDVENDKQNLKRDEQSNADGDGANTVTEINGNNSDDIEFNNCDNSADQDPEMNETMMTANGQDDSMRSVDKSEGDSIGLELDSKEGAVFAKCEETIGADDSERPVRSLTPCLDEKSESETGEISDSNDNCTVPVILSKNVLNKIQIENGSLAAAVTTASVVSSVAADPAPITIDTHPENFRSASLLHFPTLHTQNNNNNNNNETDKEPIQFKKINKSTKDRNYRDQFCNGNSFANKQASSDTFGRNRPRLESESLSAIRKHLTSDSGLGVSKTKRKVHRNDDEDSIEKHRKSSSSSHKKSKKSLSSSSASKRHRRSASRTSIMSASSSASSSSRPSTTIPLHLPPNYRSLNSSSSGGGGGGGGSGFVGGSNSRHYTPPIKHNIKVIVSNDRVQEKNAKKKDQKKSRHHKSEKRRRKQRHRTSPTIGSSFITQLPQSKKIYSTGKNILVSLTVDPKITTSAKVNASSANEDVKPIIVPNMHPDSEANSKASKSKHSKQKKKSKKTKKAKKSSKKTTDSNRKSQDGNTSPKLSNSRILNTNIDALKTLAIFDLEQSPVRELTPEPVPVIEISDSDEPSCKIVGKRGGGGGASADTKHRSSTDLPSIKHRTKSAATSASKANAIDKEQKPEKKTAESTLESELEHRLNQALNRFPTTINTASTAASPVAIDTLDTTNKNSLTLATTPRSPDVYDPFEPTSSPVSSSSINFYKSNNNEQSSITKNSSLVSNHPIDSNKNSSFSSDDVSLNHKTNSSHQIDLKSQHKSHHSGDGDGGDSLGGGRATNSTSDQHDSPYSPGMSDFDDIYDPEAVKQVDKIKLAEKIHNVKVSNATTAPQPPKTAAIANNNRSDFSSTKILNNSSATGSVPNSASLRLSEENLRMLGQMPNSSNAKDSAHDYVNKLNRQERVVEEVKFVLKPEYSKKKITKEQYKEILRKSVPKILHNRSGVINPIKIRTLILAYVKKYHYINKHGHMCDTKSDN